MENNNQIMNDTPGIEYQEGVSIRAGRFLLSRGFTLASTAGIERKSLVEDDSIGIIYDDPDDKPKRAFFGMFKRRRHFIGILWFNNELREAGRNQWVFELYGRKYNGIVMKLVSEIAYKFNVKITVKLIQDAPQLEGYVRDFYD